MADPAEAESAQADQENWSSVRKALEDRASAAEEKAAGLERILAFNKADAEWLTDVQIEAFNATYKGDMSAENVKAHIANLGFSRPDAGTSTETPAPSPQVPDTGAEVAELAALSGSAPAPPGDNPLSQEAIDAKIASLDPGEELDEWLRSNAHLFGHGIG